MAAGLRRTVAVVVVVAAALTGCAENAPSVPAVAAAVLAGLPIEGIVEDGVGKVVVRRVDGTVAAELPGMRVDGASSASRPPRLIGAEGKAHRLSGGRLVPDPSSKGDIRFSGDLPPPALPRPAGRGHWRYAFPATAPAVLAQWSGECEQPVAYRIVNGRLSGLGPNGAPVDSFALGLTVSGDPVVLFPVPACGSGTGRVGVYVLAPAGDWRPLSKAVNARYFRRAAANEPVAVRRHSVSSHCGVQSTTVGGVLWLADPPLGDHHPPTGWHEENTPGRFAQTDGTHALFTADGGAQAVFVRAAVGADDPNTGCE